MTAALTHSQGLLQKYREQKLHILLEAKHYHTNYQYLGSGAYYPFHTDWYLSSISALNTSFTLDR